MPVDVILQMPHNPQIMLATAHYLLRPTYPAQWADLEAMALILVQDPEAVHCVGSHLHKLIGQELLESANVEAIQVPPVAFLEALFTGAASKCP